MVRIDLRRGQAFRFMKLQINLRTEGAAEKIPHPCEQGDQIRRSSRQVLLSCESQHALRKSGPTLSALHCSIDETLGAGIVRQSLAEKLQITRHRHQ